ncbi:hypothetical protein SVIO_028090 [Streptomyces violaceusniger]|uniref:Uncharacterized protein n=1 Tax=Streptomyces violaceusniger TaxID=68280 RepID=A0A4D4KZ57_STRVO|nr:hypothetical protein SVIO_028090 [Streptomyces violaceusniger]
MRERIFSTAAPVWETFFGEAGVRPIAAFVSAAGTPGSVCPGFDMAAAAFRLSGIHHSPANGNDG